MWTKYGFSPIIFIDLLSPFFSAGLSEFGFPIRPREKQKRKGNIFDLRKKQGWVLDKLIKSAYKESLYLWWIGERHEGYKIYNKKEKSGM